MESDWIVVFKRKMIWGNLEKMSFKENGKIRRQIIRNLGIVVGRELRKSID